MKDDRNTMFFPASPGMGMPGMGQMTGMMPPQGMGMPGMGMPGMGQMPGMMPGQGMGQMPNLGMLENRVASLERQVKRLDARIGRLETPFPSTSQMPGQAPTQPFGGTGQSGYGSSMETPQQGTPYPYQTAMQIM